MQRVSTLWRSGGRGKLTILVLGILGVCIVCAVIGSLTPRQTPPPTTASQPGPAVQPVAQAPATLAPQATATPKPTEAPKPTDPPKPTNTPRPTDTPKPPPPTPTAAVGKVGEPRTAAGVTVGVNAVTKVQQINQFLKPQTPGNVYLVVDVLIGNDRDQETPYNPLYFKVKDNSGREYTNALLAPDPSLKFGNLAKGDIVRGNVAFEVPPDAKGFVLTYQPLVILGGYQPIRIDLGM